MLHEIIARDDRRYTEEAIGTMLADSDVDLADFDACVETIHARGVKPWQFTGSLIHAVCHAHNLRTTRKSFAEMRAKISGPLTVIALALAVFLGHAGHAMAQTYARLPGPDTSDRFLGGLLVLLGIGSLAMWLFDRTGVDPDEESIDD